MKGYFYMDNLSVDDIKRAILEELPAIQKPDKQILGFIDKSKMIYTVGLDSKIIGRLYEVLAQPILQRVANKLHLTLMTSPKQTVYPDFWLSNPQHPDRDRIAIDIKSTYRSFNKSGISAFKWTLGSYTSFLRNGTKNIAGNYDMYKYHFIIGFLYTRNADYHSQVLSLNDINKIPSPVFDTKCFVAQKYKISGEKPGSGNTANIGTFSSKKFDDFVYEKGPFSILGNAVFEDYWKHYPTPSERKDDNEKKIYYYDLSGYVAWKHRQTDVNDVDISLLDENYAKVLNQGLKLQ